jgi:hypothetical protein
MISGGRPGRLWALALPTVLPTPEQSHPNFQNVPVEDNDKIVLIQTSIDDIFGNPPNHT